VRRVEAGYRVLVVEDQKMTAMAMAKMLELEGYEVQTAGDGPSALETSRSFLPHAVFLDIGLPGMDGYEVARRLRAQPETQHIRIIALSGYGQREDIRRSREAGCDGHLVKPADLEVLVKAINRDS
jgi:two-component system CheB/CheR fusion protein